MIVLIDGKTVVEAGEILIQNERGEELEFEVLGEDLLIVKTKGKGNK